MKRFLQLPFWPIALLSLHFGLVFIFNLTNSLDSHLELYAKEKPWYPKAMSMIHHIHAVLAPFKPYRMVTGTDTGYGFYAPQVSSHIEPFFDLYRGDELVSPYFRLTFTTHEAALRFQTVFDTHLQKLDEVLGGKDLTSVNENIYYRSLDLRIHSLSTSVLNRQDAKAADRIRAYLYLYDVPSLYACTKLSEPFRPKFFKTFDYEYRLTTP